jgi:cell division protein FtsW
MLLAARLPRERLRRAALPAFLVCLALLALVLVPGLGHESNAARRWFRLGGLSFQPSEFARLALVLFLAHFLAGRGEEMASFRRGFLPAAGALAAVVGLVLVEPDFGSAVYLLFVGIALLAVGGARIVHLCAAAAAALPLLLFIGWRSFGHVRERFAYLLEGDYQGTIARVALGSGGIFGRPLGEGGLKWGYVPESRNDFVFAILGEEAGLTGCLLVVALFGAFLAFGHRAAKARREEPFDALLIFGVVFAVALQAALNLAVVTRLAPPKGIALPFVSAGGTSMTILGVGVGLAAAAASRAAVSAGTHR